MAYWLFKTEPDEFSIDDLCKRDQAMWNGVRNYEARNYLRDEIKADDLVFIYHSSCRQVGIAGIAKVVREAYPDPSQFDEHSPYFDNKAKPQEPRWYCVDITHVKTFDAVLLLKVLKQQPELEGMPLIKRPRLSVQPVKQAQWDVINTMT